MSKYFISSLLKLIMVWSTVILVLAGCIYQQKREDDGLASQHSRDYTILGDMDGY